MLNYCYKMDALCIASIKWRKKTVHHFSAEWPRLHPPWRIDVSDTKCGSAPKKKNNQTLYLQYILDTHDVSAFHDDVG